MVRPNSFRGLAKFWRYQNSLKHPVRGDDCDCSTLSKRASVSQFGNFCADPVFYWGRVTVSVTAQEENRVPPKRI